MTSEEILKYPAIPGQSIDLEKVVPYATFENHPEPIEMEWYTTDEEPSLGMGKMFFAQPPVEWGRRTGVYIPPKEKSNDE